MLFGFAKCELEVRNGADGSRIIAGRFAYGAETELAPNRRERFEARAFASRIDAGEDVHLLAQHDFTKPLASRSAGTLEIRDDDNGVTFEARISPGIADTSHGRDALAMIDAGLAAGLSPGFRVPDGGSTITASGSTILRSIHNAELHEMSIVTRGAYPNAQVEARTWTPFEAIQRVAPERMKSVGALRWR